MSNIVINFIGGEGVLAGVAFYNLAKMGMFNSLNDNITVNQIDLSGTSMDSTRFENAKQEYETFAKTLFGEGEEKKITHQNFTEAQLKNQGVCNFVDCVNTGADSSQFKYSLENKFNKQDDKELLSIGCTDKDMSLDVKSGVYGNHRVGKVYHSDADFSRGVVDVRRTDVLINVASYYGGTGITFTPILNSLNLNSINVNTSNPKPTFAVISAPCTAYNKYITLSHDVPDSKYTRNARNDSGKCKVSIFDAQEVLNEVDATTRLDQPKKDLIKDEINAFFGGLGDTRVTPQSLSKDGNFHHLDYNNYFKRFTNELLADSTLANNQASIINMKPDLEINQDNEFNYDITSEKFSLDTQKHMMSSINLVMACSVIDILKDLGSYKALSQGSICCYTHDTLSIDGILRPEDLKAKDRFMATSLITVYYLRWVFKSIGYAQWINKWGAYYTIRRGIVFTSKQDPAKEDSGKDDNQRKSFKLNSQFLEEMSKLVENFSNDYVKSVLEFFMEIEKTSGIPISNTDNSYFETLYNYIKTSSDDTLKQKEDIYKCVVGLLEQILSNYCQGNAEQKAHEMITKYQEVFPELTGDDALDINSTYTNDNIKEKVEKYFREIIKVTYGVVSDIIN